MPRLPFLVFREGVLVPRPRLLRKWNAGVFGLSRVYRTFNPYPPAFLWTHWALPAVCVSLAGPRRPLREAHRPPPSARGRACRPTLPRAARTVQTSAAASRGPRRSSPVEQWMRGQQGRLARRKVCARLNRCWAAPVRIRRQDPDFSASDGHPASQQGGRVIHACRIKPSGLRGTAAARRGTDLYRPRGRPMPVAFANLPCTRGANLRLSIIQDKIMRRENLFPWIRPSSFGAMLLKRYLRRLLPASSGRGRHRARERREAQRRPARRFP